MTPIRHPSPSSRASSSGTRWSHRDPTGPSLTRIDQYSGLCLDLTWAYGAGQGRPTACPVLDGRLFMPPPIGPMDKGKKPLRPLSGDHDFRWGHDTGSIYALEIQQDADGRAGHRWIRYYCDLSQPRVGAGWIQSYTHFRQALRGSVTPPRMRPERLTPPPQAAPPKVAASSTLLEYTAQEAMRQLKKLKNDCGEQNTIMWGTYAQHHLLAVLRVPRPLWMRLLCDRGRLWNYEICHRRLHDGWEYHDAHLVGGKIAPRRHGENALVETHDPDLDVAWLLELGIAEDGQAVARINERDAHLVPGVGQCAATWKA